MVSEGSTGRNILRLYGYNLFTALAITVVCNFVFLDKLLLRLEIDLSRFGMIKGSMYVASAVLYMIFTPLLQRNPGTSDKLICIWAYLFRATLPALLPVIALFTDNQELLTWSAVVLLSLGMTLAAFANNSLMSLYRLVLPEEHFNRRVGMMNLLISLPASLLGVLMAWILDQYDSADTRTFLIIFTIMQLICVFFEVPAMFLMKRLELPDTILKHSRSLKGSLWKPWCDRAYVPILLLVLLHGFVGGAWIAYLGVYFLTVCRFDMSALVLAGLILSLLLTGSLPFSGQLTDRIGYRRMFLILSFGSFAGGVLFCCFPGNLWMLIPFAILLWDGNVSLFSGCLGYGLYAAGSKLAKSELTTCYISAFSLCRNGGIFIGSLIGSLVYSLLEHHFHGRELFTYYFWGILPLSGLLLGASLIYRFMKPQNQNEN